MDVRALAAMLLLLLLLLLRVCGACSTSDCQHHMVHCRACSRYAVSVVVPLGAVRIIQQPMVEV
jgi:hypothetical protein